MLDKIKRIEVTYGDGSQETYDSIPAAEEGIGETVNGCDLATNVEYIRAYDAEGNHLCNFTAGFFCKLDAQPAV